MITCNAARIIERCLRSVMDHVEEIIIVDTASDDNTKEVIKAVCPWAKVFDYTHQTHLESFILDAKVSWEKEVPGPFSNKWRLGDFAAARQYGWEKASAEYLMWIDSDDTVDGAEKLVEVVDDMRDRQVNVALLNYDYDHDDRGNVTMKLPRERIIKRSINSHWEQPVHEVCMPSGLGTYYQQVNIVHHRTSDKLPPLWHNRNLKILLKWFQLHAKEVEADTVDPRMMFYMGMEARFLWPEYALDMFKRYVKRSGWDEERAQANFLAGTVHERAGRFEDAKNNFALVTVEFPANPDGFFGLARCAYYRNDWNKVVEWTERGFEVATKNEGRPTMLMEDPHDRKWRPHVFLSVALMNLRQFTKVIEICEEGLKYNPTEPHMIGNLEEARKSLDKQGDVNHTSGVVNLMFRRSEPLSAPPLDIPHDILALVGVQLWKRVMPEAAEKALRFLNALPEKIAVDPKVQEALKVTLTKLQGAKAPAELEAKPEVENVEPSAEPLVDRPMMNIEVGKQPMKIAIWTGPAWEPWSPASLKTGIGGSETAAIHVAAELGRRGHKVWLLGMHDGVEGDVEYVHNDRALKQEGPWKNPDIFLVSRQPIVLLNSGFSWQAAYVWCHDVHCGVSPEVKTALLKADKVLALSRWHKSHLMHTYQFLADEHIVVTRNGIATGRFHKRPNKIGNKLIYASSPDRGVERLLELFPRIRAEVPNAELEIYYGFNTWRAMCENYGDTKGMDKIRYYEDLLTNKVPPGVKFMGRVGQQQLADAYLKAKVMAYPTWFSETSCISAMEAQAAGCVPVTSALAALEETVQHGFLLGGAENTREYGDQFVETVVKLLKEEVIREQYAIAGRNWAMESLGWDGVVREWEAMFLSAIAQRKPVVENKKSKLILPGYAGM